MKGVADYNLELLAFKHGNVGKIWSWKYGIQALGNVDMAEYDYELFLFKQYERAKISLRFWLRFFIRFPAMVRSYTAAFHPTRLRPRWHWDSLCYREPWWQYAIWRKRTNFGACLLSTIWRRCSFWRRWTMDFQYSCWYVNLHVFV